MKTGLQKRSAEQGSPVANTFSKGGRSLPHVPALQRQGNIPHPISARNIHPAQRTVLQKNEDERGVAQLVKWETVRKKPWISYSDSYVDQAGTRWILYHVDTDAGSKIEAMRPQDNTSYFCHGYTFGGYAAEGGPFSIDCYYVPTVLNDEYKELDAPRVGDVVAFYGKEGVDHTGIISSIDTNEPDPDKAIMIDSKLGTKDQAILPLGALKSKYTKHVKFFGKNGEDETDWWTELGFKKLDMEEEQLRELENRDREISVIQQGLKDNEFLMRIYSKLLRGGALTDEELVAYHVIKDK